MKKQLSVFATRWLLNSLGIWVALRLFGTGFSDAQVAVNTFGILTAGLMFSIINSVLKPVIVVLSLPAIMITLGLFMIVVNGLMVYISLALTPGISMTFFNSMLTGIVLSLVNYIVSAMLIVKSDSVK